MSKHFVQNIKKAKYHLAFIFATIFYSYKYTSDRVLKEYFFGKDGKINFYLRKRRRYAKYLYLFNRSRNCLFKIR